MNTQHSTRNDQCSSEKIRVKTETELLAPQVPSPLRERVRERVKIPKRN